MTEPAIFHVRTCQECGHRQTDVVPKKITDAWLEKPCKRCKSPALDYGSDMVMGKNGWESPPWNEEDDDWDGSTDPILGSRIE